MLEEGSLRYFKETFLPEKLGRKYLSFKLDVNQKYEHRCRDRPVTILNMYFLCVQPPIGALKAGNNTRIYFGRWFSRDHHLVIRILQLGFFEGVNLPRHPLFSISLYITSRFAYMKHHFCWYLTLIFLYKLSFGSNVLFPYSSCCFPYLRPYENCFFLVEFENSEMMHAHYALCIS